MTPSDEELVRRALDGEDARAFDALVLRHQAAVRSLLRRLCREAPLADDLAQETFFKAYGSLERFSGAGSFKAWLGGIAYREFLMAMRVRRRETRKLAAVAREASTASRTDLPDASIDLDRALAQLPEKQRDALVLNLACGLSHREIALAMGAPVGTVKTWIASAKEAFRIQREIDEGHPK